MRAPDRLPPVVRDLLTQRRRRAEQARAAIVRDLASQDLDALATIPGKTWNRLGLRDVLALIRTHRDLAPLAPASPPVAPVRSRAPERGTGGRLRKRLSHWRAVRPLPVVTVAALLRGAAGGMLLSAAILPAREIAWEAGWISRPEACPRLDRWTGGCTYTARADGLTLDRVAAALGRPIAELVAANPDLPPLRPLRHGAQIVVPPRPLLHPSR